MIFYLKKLNDMLLAALALSGAATEFVDTASNQGEEVLITDVCIIGGGGSGAYAAVRLLDLGKDVVVVERESALGGHTHSYTDPETNQEIGYGVAYYRNIKPFAEFMNRLNIPFKNVVGTNNGDAITVNFRTGQLIPNDRTEVPESLSRYRDIVASYAELENGFYLPDHVPDDLVMPFHDFVQKYNLSDVVPFLFRGYGDVLSQPTLYVINLFGSSFLHSFESGFLEPASENNQDIYKAAFQVLGPRVFLDSQPVSVDRDSADHVMIRAQTPNGIKGIKAKKVLVTIPPTIDNLGSFKLDPIEGALFSAFKVIGHYVAVAEFPGFQNASFTNRDQHRPFSMPQLPAVYEVAPSSNPELLLVHYGSHSELSDSFVKQDILDSLKRLRDFGFAPANSEPELVAYRNHSPFLLAVSPDDIKAGFYKKLYSLQGWRNTFYTGLAFQGDDSPMLWKFTEDLLPRILESIDDEVCSGGPLS
ncbi:hypothetical protein FQN55_005194 [Onygenales sp. PD_40]|nr:hypothetical protein FQN55_005194 [Onygenales sp. PD_40]